jgi:hypothetical protein
MEAIRSSESSVLTTASRLHIPEDGILRIWPILSYHLPRDVKSIYEHQDWCRLSPDRDSKGVLSNRILSAARRRLILVIAVTSLFDASFNEVHEL